MQQRSKARTTATNRVAAEGNKCLQRRPGSECETGYCII